MREHLYGLVSVLLLVVSVSRSTGQTLLFSVQSGGQQVDWQSPPPVAVVGDVNGDGVPDLAVGQPHLDRVVICSGADGTRLHTLRAPSPQPFARFGAALAGVGDVNDDGVPDLAVGAPGQDVEDRDDEGAVLIFSGADGTRLRTLRAPSPQPFANFGAALAGVGDVNDDGVPDLAVGAPNQAVEDDRGAGAVLIFSGADGTRLRTLRAPRPQPFANFGAALAGVGDVNDDGVPDLAVGAPNQAVEDVVARGQCSSSPGPMAPACAPCGPRVRSRVRSLATPWLAWGMSTVMASPTWPSAPPSRMWRGRTVVTTARW